MPPLSITRRELERVTDITIESINHVT